MDIGGQWVGPKQLLVTQLIGDLGLELETQKWFEEEKVFDDASSSRDMDICSSAKSVQLCSGASSGLTPEVSMKVFSMVFVYISCGFVQDEELLRIEIESIESLSKSVFSQIDWAITEQALQLDSITASQYLQATIAHET